MFEPFRFALLLGALGAAGVFALAVAALGRRHRDEYPSFTALVLVGALGLGVILASDVFHSGSSVETLLFGSLLLIGDSDLVVAAAATATAVVATLALGRRWLATGFDPVTSRALGARSALPELALLVLVSLTVVASLAALGVLLVSALLVLPAASARLWTHTLRSWQLASVALAAAEGAAGLWLAVEANVPPGAAIAVVAGGVFALAALPRALPAVAVAGLVLAGCAVSVHQILQPNTDPHEYEPRSADVEATSGAKVVFESGDGLDHWMPKVISSAGGHPRVVDLGEVVPIKLDDDPHWWHDPRNAEAAVIAIRNALARAIPGEAGTFRRNATDYFQRLRTLDHGIAACFSGLPAEKRKLVTNHDAFAYFAHRYHVRVVGAVIPSTTTEAQATGASANYTLYGDTLGPGQTYLEMERANADAMMRGLTGGSRGCFM